MPKILSLGIAGITSFFGVGWDLYALLYGFSGAY